MSSRSPSDASQERKERRRQMAAVFTFDWLPMRNTGRTLLAFALFSFFIHLVAFYLFQVVYPEPKRADVREARITLLDPADSDVRFFLERAHDRMVFLEPASTQSAAEIQLSDHTVRFEPSFARARPSLRSTHDRSAELSFSAPAPALDDALPLWSNRVRLSPNLDARGIAPQSMLDEYLDLIEQIPDIRVNFSVRPDGTPIEIQVGGDTSEQNKQILAVAIAQTLRFQPGPAELGRVPGWLELGGERAPKAQP